MHPEPVQRYHLRYPTKSLGSRASCFIGLSLHLVMWRLESLHYSHVPSLPRPDSIWPEQALQLNTTNWWLKCMILLSVILLLPNFCQKAFLGKLFSQLGLENRQLVQGKNMLVYNHIFSNEPSSKIASLFRQLLSDLKGWWNNMLEGIKFQTEGLGTEWKCSKCEETISKCRLELQK